MASSARPRPQGRKPTTPSRLIRSSLTVGIAIAVANGLTAVTQLALARLLHPAEYSLVVTLFVVITIAGVPLAALQATVAREVAADHSARGAAGAGAALVESARELVRLSIPVWAALAVLALPAAIVLNVQHVTPILATIVTVAASVGLTIVWAGLQGTRRFGVLSLGQAGFAVAKLILAIGAARAGAIAAAALATLLLGLAQLTPYLRAAAHLERVRRPLLTRYSRGALATRTPRGGCRRARAARGPSRSPLPGAPAPTSQPHAPSRRDSARPAARPRGLVRQRRRARRRGSRRQGCCGGMW